MRQTTLVQFHELVDFAVKNFDYVRDDAVALLDGVRPEYEVTTMPVDLDDMEDEVNEIPDQFKDPDKVKEQITVLRAFCLANDIDNEFTVADD